MSRVFITLPTPRGTLWPPQLYLQWFDCLIVLCFHWIHLNVLSVQTRHWLAVTCLLLVYFVQKKWSHISNGVTGLKAFKVGNPDGMETWIKHTHLEALAFQRTYDVSFGWLLNTTNGFGRSHSAVWQKSGCTWSQHYHRKFRYLIMFYIWFVQKSLIYYTLLLIILDNITFLSNALQYVQGSQSLM